MQHFIEIRETIDKLIDETKSWIRKKSISDSMEKLGQARDLFNKLKSIATSEQKSIISKRATQLEALATDIDNILSKREAGKKEDGNIAFKCNWNDKHYQAPCSEAAYRYNLSENRAWCSLSSNNCQDFDANVSLGNHPCYESIALKEMYFAAGWDTTTAEKTQPRRIHSARKGRVAILTTRPPGSEEKDRIIVGCLLIDRITEDPGKETEIFGDKARSIDIDYNLVKVRFWDYYKNAGDENLKLWASGLFRYITDETVLNILMGLGEQLKNANRDVAKVVDLVRYYEGIVKKKPRQ